ncbi:hypothetical protein [Streptomyces sp. NPDC085665]|uniref:hypothetical protein n=1 Tax=Streptomyces sp. NPDC085665 TaxID=3365735 RepID=UPI0037CDD83C
MPAKVAAQVIAGHSLGEADILRPASPAPGRRDQDPSEWLPSAPEALCWYGAGWTATKLRWGLAVDEMERERLLDIAGG